MAPMKNVFSMLLLLLTLCSCAQQQTQTKEVFSFENKLTEVSGMVYNADKTFWVLQDSGNKNELYRVDSTGSIIHTLELVNQNNTDWEELTSDSQGNLYIGDFGNNKNSRKNLRILKINQSDLNKDKAEASAVINFKYPEQTLFPPAKENLLYDAEAFVLYQNHFYIFTKNRSKGFDGTSLIYRVPNQDGAHQATLISSFKTCAKYSACAITAAAISPDQKTIVLLSHSQLWTLKNFTQELFFKPENLNVYPLNHNSQKESVAFKDNQTLYLADEVKKEIGGKVYTFTLPTTN